MEKVKSGGSWILDNQLMVLKQWTEGIEEKEDGFNKVDIWVQLWNLPLNWLTKETAKKIGSAIGVVKESIVPEIGSKEGRHMKILVEIDITQPLMHGTFVKLGNQADGSSSDTKDALISVITVESLVMEKRVAITG